MVGVVLGQALLLWCTTDFMVHHCCPGWIHPCAHKGRNPRASSFLPASSCIAKPWQLAAHCCLTSRSAADQHASALLQTGMLLDNKSHASCIPSLLLSLSPQLAASPVHRDESAQNKSSPHCRHQTAT